MTPPMAEHAAAAARRIRHRFLEANVDDTGYPFEMTLEAFCEWHLLDPDGGWLEPVDQAWRAHGWQPGVPFPWEERYFASHDDALARARPDDRIRQAFVDETARMLSEESRDSEGLVAFSRPHPQLPTGRLPLLIDSMQEYAARLASAADLGGDPAWFDVAAHQFPGYARILRNPETGLWHLARDFRQEPGVLSVGAWSRGHGWLLRGMVETMRWLPAEHPGRETIPPLLVQVLEALAPLQDADGMWHAMLHRPWSDSAAETTGTGLIGYAIARAVADGYLPSEPWVPVAEQAIAGVCAAVDEQGIVHGACVGPGTLFDHGEDLYLHKPIEPDDPHGAPCALYASLGAQLLHASRSHARRNT